MVVEALRPAAGARRLAQSFGVANALYAAAGLLILLLPLAIYRDTLHDFFLLDDFIWLQAAAAHGPMAYLRDSFGHPPETPWAVPTPFTRSKWTWRRCLLDCSDLTM